MGTNYYLHTNVCEHCGRSDEPLHIGKSSAGWTFGFHGTEEIRSYRDWLKVLRAGGIIKNEYGEVVTLEEFEEMVRVKKERAGALNHTTYCMEDPSTRDYAQRHCWLDDEGNSFSGGVFS